VLLLVLFSTLPVASFVPSSTTAYCHDVRPRPNGGQRIRVALPQQPQPPQEETKRKKVALLDLSLSSSMSASSSSAAGTRGSSSKDNNIKRGRDAVEVVYQKVVAPPPGLPDIVFLGYLVEYLQEHFAIPDRLPMVYERRMVADQQQQQRQPTENNDAVEGEQEEDRKGSVQTKTSAGPSSAAVVQFDSPLSPDPAFTCLSVQVVGIYRGREDRVPNLAMVVVEKTAKPQASAGSYPALLPPMLQNLFADSEKKILRALDRGLEDFANGKVQGLGSPEGSGKGPMKQTYQEAAESMLAELMDDDYDGYEQEGDGSGNDDHDKNERKTLTKDAIDADIEVVPDGDTKKEGSATKKATVEQRAAVLRTMSGGSSSSTSTLPGVAGAGTLPSMEGPGLDFAVRAAKQAQSRRQKRTNEQVEGMNDDFAVQAARRVAATAAGVKPRSTTEDQSRRSDSTSDLDATESPDLGALDMSKLTPPALDPNASGRAFMATISRTEDYASARQKKTSRKKIGQSAPSIGHYLETAASPTDSSANKAPSGVGPAMNDSTVRRRKNINLTFKENEKEPVIGPSVDDTSDETTKQIIKSEQEALTELAEGSKDMTPEELLEDVMKFGREKEREKAVGGGFVSGAFDKAKELLREQREKREASLRQEAVNQIATESVNGHKAEAQKNVEVKELGPEEELRAMFRAGERIAEGRLANVMKAPKGGPFAKRQTSESDVDDMINSEKSISSYARVLDEELTELEVRINKSPGQEYDGPAKNPMFDIFTGLETYNPNVDAETTVNWPGALPGTRTIRLPAQLDEAVKQAKFAAEVLLNLQEGDNDDNGTKTYKVGKRMLTERQVTNMRGLVEEAVEIGLIDDPLEIQEEAARLQMLLDELAHQLEERFRDISSNYKDLLLSDNFVQLMKERLNAMADRDLDALRRDDDSLEQGHARERALLGQLVVYAQLLLKETRALGAELESQQIEVIRSICKVAMDPSHRTEEETSMALTDAVRDMRPMFDDAFVAYLKYAVMEEEGRLARAGVLDDPEHNKWLFVLKIVQQGVYTEIARSINRYIEHIWYILRMETQVERRRLLEELVNVMPTLDVRPFVQVVENIVGSLGESVKGDFMEYTPLGEMTNKLLQLRRDVKDVLPADRIAEMSKDADEWAARQKKRLLEARTVTKQRLRAAQDTEHLDGEIESMGRRYGGDVERFSML
jgi:hypothetical protein